MLIKRQATKRWKVNFRHFKRLLTIDDLDLRRFERKIPHLLLLFWGTFTPIFFYAILLSR